jgi:hypothetical protein
MQMTIPLIRWQVRQDSKNDFCFFRCVIRPIQKMFELKSFFTLDVQTSIEIGWIRAPQRIREI